MFCGIGNPKEFENTLLKYKFKLQRKFIYADHHNFSDEEIDFLKKIAKKNKLELITTEKDYLRLNLNSVPLFDYFLLYLPFLTYTCCNFKKTYMIYCPHDLSFPL